jgi:hypothetical protein
MKLRTLAVVAALAFLMSTAHAQSVFSGKLAGFHETPAVVSAGSGHVRVVISDDEQSIRYELSYGGLEGIDPSAGGNVAGGKVLFAHIHIGQRNVAGGVVVFFCGGGKSSVTQAACPQSGTVSGTWTAADVLAVGTNGAQGIDPANTNEDAFARLIKAIRAGKTYANVHSTRSPSGEIRGQLLRGNGGNAGNRDNDEHRH